jgi:uncharacterized protein (DUF169 family)
MPHADLLNELNVLNFIRDSKQGRSILCFAIRKEWRKLKMTENQGGQMMENVDTLKGHGIEIERLLRMKTYPVAAKMLKQEKEIPETVKRPKKNLGHHLSLCQAINLARREGESLALLKDDMWCYLPVIGLGMAEPPQYYLEGEFLYPRSVKTPEIGRKGAQSLPRLEAGRYAGIAVGPIGKVDFVPDLFILYVDSLQLVQLLMAKRWMDGGDLTITLSGTSACVYTIVPVVKERQFQVSIPCLGDRKMGMATDEEIIFSGPAERLGELVAGLSHLKESGRGLPLSMPSQIEYRLFDSYVKIGKMIGMDL